MALHPYTLKLLQVALDRTLPAESRRAAMFSCHDVVASKDALARLFGESVRFLPYRADSDAILRWHKATDLCEGVVDTNRLFACLGWELDCFDVVRARGCELHQDLNDPFPYAYYRRYQFLYDNVLGQVFNAGQCLRSAIELLDVGGYLLSVSAANSPNHGFYSVSPTLYHDALTQNGFDIIVHNVMTDLFRTATEHDFKATTGTVLPHGAVNVVLAHKARDVKFRYPVQTKFARTPDSKVTVC